MDVTKETVSLQILYRFNEIQPYIERIHTAGDSARDALGFLPRGVYDEVARHERIYVLVKNDAYAGHLMFSLKYPRAKVLQMFVLPTFRRAGAASILLDRLKSDLTNAGFTSIYAAVAEDLLAANAFWERQGFQIQSVKKGGDSRKRMIWVRCHELGSPQLFPPSQLNKENPLGLKASTTGTDRLFLLDLNVIFDITGPRRVRHEKAVSLFQAERSNLCSLAISTEIRSELKATATPGKTDPMEGFIDIFPEFPLTEYESASPLLANLRNIIFPTKEALSRNDISDLRHVATAIENNIAGVITNDEAMLNSARQLKYEFGIDVISPDAFEVDNIGPQSILFEGQFSGEIKLQHVDNTHQEVVRELLKQLEISNAKIATIWLPIGNKSLVVTQLGVWADTQFVGYMTWNISVDAKLSARLAVKREHASTVEAARIMLVFLIEHASTAAGSTTRIDLELAPSSPAVRDVAISLGFKGSPGHEGLFKIALGAVVTAQNWLSQRDKLYNRSGGIKLPDSIPTYRAANQPIALIGNDGELRHIPLNDLESLIAPVLLCLPGRPAVITPIQRDFAEPLLGHSGQLSFLPNTRASLHQDRHYFCDPKALRYFKHGTIIFFYESSRNHGRKSIVAMARVQHAHLKHSSELGNDDYGHSVLNGTTISKIGRSRLKTVVVFDNIFLLPRLISYESLKRLGCVPPTNLVSTNQISDVQTQAILNEAFAHD